jgi:hypothetical protein
MSLLSRWVVYAGALLLGVGLALPARGQGVSWASGRDSAVHRMEVWNGPVRSVHYFSYGISPGEQASLRDLERAENEVAVADGLLGLRALYLRNERLLEQRRGEVQRLLYGYSSQYAASLLSPPGGAGYGEVVSAAGYTYPYAYAVGAGYYNGVYPFSVYPYGAAAVAASSPFPVVGGLVGTASNSLAFGVGDEGHLKADLARSLAAQATPETSSQAARALDNALARVSESTQLRTALWGKDVAAVGHERAGQRVTVTTKDGKTVEGTLVREDASELTLGTRDGERVLNKSIVVDRLYHKGGNKPEEVKPARP